jgi:pilus assembly protein Flp/PilA
MLIRLYQRLRLNERGASMVEYALLVTLIALVALLAVTLAGTELSGTYSEIASDLEYAGT